MELIYAITTAVITGVITGVSAYTAIHIEIKYLRRDIDSLHDKLTKHLEVNHG